MFPKVLKSRTRGEIAIVYTMLVYKPKLIHNEDYTLYLYPMRQNGNAYPME